MSEKTLWDELKCWIIEKLGGVTKEELIKSYMRKDIVCEELSEKDREINSLKNQLASPSLNVTKNETIYVESHTVEPVELIRKFAIRDFHKEFDMEKVEKVIIDDLTTRIAQDIVSNKLYEVMWCDENNPPSFERVMNVRVRVVPPRENGGHHNGTIY